jgi:hypothetical protein
VIDLLYKHHETSLGAEAMTMTNTVRIFLSTYFRPAPGESALSIGQILVAGIVATGAVFAAAVALGLALYYV